MEYRRTWVPLGYARFASLGSAITVGTSTPTAGTIFTSLRQHPNHAIVTVYTQNVRVRDDGTAPTASEGERLEAGSKMVIENAPDSIRGLKVIEEAASAVITVRYYA